MLEKQNLRLEEFRELMWDDYISEKIISTGWLEDNRDYVDEISYDLWRLYYKSNGTLSMRICARMLESFILNSFRYQPDQIDKYNHIDFSEE